MKKKIHRFRTDARNSLRIYNIYNIYIQVFLYFVGFFSNHSLRATCATRLYRAGVEEQRIMETTGHRSLAVRRYKRTSNEQKKEITTTLQAASSTATSSSNESVTTSYTKKRPDETDGQPCPVNVHITGKNFSMSFDVQ